LSGTESIPIITYIWGIAVVLFTFGFMIFVHELGHFLMAKRVGITVHEFALGFGPRFVRFRRREDGSLSVEFFPGDLDEEEQQVEGKEVRTEYCLRIVPFGGFVRMEGEDCPGNLDDPGNFNNKTAWERAKVIVAGCAMNYITGVTMLLIVGFVWGIGIGIRPAKVGTVKKGYPLEKAGVKPGDKIVMIDGEPVKDFEHLRNVIGAKKDGDVVELKIERPNEEPFTVNVEVKYDRENKRAMLGFMVSQNEISGFKFIKVPPKDVILFTLDQVKLLTLSPIIVVERIVSKKMTIKEVEKGTAGPLGIGHMIFEISKMGIAPIIYICALLSILIGAFNLIPFPALDGSRLLFLGLEKIRNRPLDPEKEGMIHQVGFIVLIILVIIVTFGDIVRIVSGRGFFK